MNTELYFRGRSEAPNTPAQPFVWFGYKSGGILTLKQGPARPIYLATNDAYDVQPREKYWVNEAVRPINPVAQDEGLGAIYGRGLRRCCQFDLIRQHMGLSRDNCYYT